MIKKKSNTFYDIVKTILQGFWSLIKGLLRLALKILVTLGLWLPGLYAVLGVILYYGLDFNPFDFSVYSIIYLSGAFACIICAAIISVRNLVVNPVKKVFTRKRRNDYDDFADEEFEVDRQAEERLRFEEEEKFFPPRKEEKESSYPEYLVDEEEGKNGRTEEPSKSNLLYDVFPKKKTRKEEPEVRIVPKKEIPEVYYSKLNPNILVHEYSDRFELFRTVGDRTEFVGVEYKQ